MLEFYLIRHAESERNKEVGLVGGRSHLTKLSAERGYSQAALLGDRLDKEGIRFSEIHSSTAIRSAETAIVSCMRMGISLKDIIYSDRLVEMDQGDWEGRNRDEIYTSETIDQINKDNWNFAAPNGESQRQVEERMISYINDIIARQTEGRKTIALFTHGMSIKCALRGILFSDPALTYKICIDNTSITRLKYSKAGWHIVNINDTYHLYGKEKLEDRYANEW